MVAISDKRRARLLGSLLLLIAVAVYALNVPGFFWEPLPLWFRITIPGLLIAGFVGTLVYSRILRVVGWISIAWFTLLVLYIVALTDDYIFRGTPAGLPNVPNAAAFVWRILLVLGISVLLIIFFRRLAKTSTASTSGNAGG
jgi:hypothetical protein